MTTVTKMTRVFQDREVSFECIEKNQRMIDTLKCYLCLEIFKEPRMTDCGHKFCSSCLIKVKPTKKCDEHDWCMLKECPLCRKIVHPGMLIKDLHLSSTIDSIQVRCLQKLNSECGNYICSEEIYVEGIENHLKNNCHYCLVNCKYECGSSNYIFDRDEHESSCLKNPETKIHCPKCSESVYAVFLKKHTENDCPEGIVSCTVTSFCKKKIKRCELEQHVKNESFEHINILNKRMDIRFEIINKLEKELNEKDKKHSEEIKRMKRRIREYERERPKTKNNYISIQTWENEVSEFKKDMIDIVDGKPKQL